MASREGFEEILQILKEIRHITVSETRGEVFESVVYFINNSRFLDNLVAILTMYSN